MVATVERRRHTREDGALIVAAAADVMIHDAENGRGIHVKQISGGLAGRGPVRAQGAGGEQGKSVTAEAIEAGHGVAPWEIAIGESP